MGIYNCSDTLREAVESIQNQTYQNFEIIMCDDGSTDDTYIVARAIADKDERVILLRNEHNLGLNQTLNKCLSVATGYYIARMDGDDLSLPDRFEKQVRLLESENDYQITSSPMILFDETGDWGKTTLLEFPTPADVVEGTAICHGAVMLRKECIDAVGGYTVDKRMLRVEDVNLWIKLYTAGYRCHNIQEPLYKMRNDQNALNRRKYIYRINSVYVRLMGCRMLRLGAKSYVKACIPMVNGIVPARLRQAVRKIQRGGKR